MRRQEAKTRIVSSTLGLPGYLHAARNTRQSCIDSWTVPGWFFLFHVTVPEQK